MLGLGMPDLVLLLLLAATPPVTTPAAFETPLKHCWDKAVSEGRRLRNDKLTAEDRKSVV